MCGIAGYIGINGRAKIAELTHLLSHRGPDDSGLYSDLTVNLGHRRLSIIDLSDAGHQPMFYMPEKGASSEKYNSEFIETSKVGIVLNGEIYNFTELKSRLQKRGYTFTTRCDTEVVLASYLEWGFDCVNHFNGMWAFCIYDKIKNILFLSRDRTGKKPLYYFHKNNDFIFGSELKVLLKSGIEKDIDLDSLNYYLLFRFTPSDNSILKNVKKLEPAHNLIFDLKEKNIVQKYSYWIPEFKSIIKNEEEAKREILSKLDLSVQKRMIADVPVGAFLSGGVDSSAIVFFMRKYVNDLKTFSVKFDHADYNESKWAQIVSSQFKTEHHEIEFTATDVLSLIPSLTDYYDEPYADASMIPTFLVSKVASQHVTVCLSGTGGDELFGGYHRYQEMITLNKLNHAPVFFKNIICCIYSLINSDKAGKLKQLLKCSNDTELYIKLFSHLFRNKKEIDIDLSKVSSLEKYFSSDNLLTNLLNFDQQIFLPDDLLVKEDRATMGNSIEGRMPFLDYRLIELANTISPELKICKGEGKYILKKTLEGILSKEILYRKKQGFGVPLDHYFRKEIKDFAYDKIFNFDSFSYYNKGHVMKLWDYHQKGQSDYSPLFWIIIMFNQWYEKWMM